LIDSRICESGPSAEAVEFVRFCYRRRRIGWPELYDEMCAVASRGLYRGWGTDELSDEGVGFSLYQMPTLAALVSRVVTEERERQLAGTTASVVRSDARSVDVGRPIEHTEAQPHEGPPAPIVSDETRRQPASLRLAGAAVGA
jgi:hypothetical protein